MLLGFMLIMLIIGVGLGLSIYSMYLPFVQDLGNVKFYNSAYYAAMGSIERASLILKYHAPGFEGSGGFLVGSTPFGPASDTITTGMTMVLKPDNGMYRKIKSRTLSIPALGQGNIRVLFRSGSQDFNELPYYSKETIALQLDPTTSATDYYIPVSSLDTYAGNAIEMHLRVNPLIFSGFGSVPDGVLHSSVDQGGDRLADDQILSWSLKGQYNNKPYTVFPPDDVFYFGTSAVISSGDMIFRETAVNAVHPISNGIHSPMLVWGNTSGALQMPGRNPGFIVVSEDENILSGWDYTDFFTNSVPETLSFSLMNDLQSEIGAVYPFLEYKIDFDASVADRFYTIEGVGKVGDYEVNIVVKKPTVKGNVMGDFTVVF